MAEAIELRQISAGYGERRVLDRLSLNIKKGELLAVIGPNGCGKSTLFKAIVGILPPCGGEILIDGTPSASLSRVERARRVSYLAQGRSTPDMTVWQTVLHGRFPHVGYPRRYSQKDRDVAKAALEQMGISHLADSPLSSLSGGMRQSAYIAMALAQSTDYILLDEPSTYLDIANQAELMRTLRSLCDGGRGVALVTHELPLALSFADRVAVMDGGRLLMLDTPRAVCASGIIRRIFGAELEYSEDIGYFYRYVTKSRNYH